jgi:hypothetical protein
MTARIWPADAVSGAPVYAGRALRQLLAPFAGFAPPGRPLGAISGVRQGTPTNTVSATSSTWTVRPFAAFIDVEAAAAAGGYAVAFDANVTGAMNAADATNPRIDLISVQVNDPAESDGTSISTPPFAQIIYTAGTAAASPTVPATPARCLVLAQINVAAAGGGSPTTTWVAPAFGVPPRAQYYQRTATDLTTSTYTKLTLFNRYVDTIGIDLTAGPGNFVMPTGSAGSYKLSGSVSMDSVGAGICAAAIYVNGSTVNSMQIPAAVVTCRVEDHHRARRARGRTQPTVTR